MNRVRGAKLPLIVGVDGTGSNVIVSDHDKDATDTDRYIAEIKFVPQSLLKKVRDWMSPILAKNGLRSPENQDPGGNWGVYSNVEAFKQLVAQDSNPDILNVHPALRKIWGLPISVRVKILEYIYYTQESASAWTVEDYKLSFVRRICNEYAVINSEWINGPSNTGDDCKAIGQQALQVIRQWRSNMGATTWDKGEKVNRLFLTGYSRGGAIVVWVAKQLLTEDKLDVDCLFLFDAVDRAWDLKAPELNVMNVPPNVNRTYHATRDDLVNSRPGFGHTAVNGLNNFERRNFCGTHAAMGGQPWRGDHPKGQTSEADHAASYAVWAYMYPNLLRHGVVGSGSVGGLGQNYSRAMHP